MEVLTIIGLLFVLLVGWLIWSKLMWKTLMVGSDIQSEEAIRNKYKQLKARRIRCRLKRESQTLIVTGVTPMVGNPAPPNASQTIIKLLVHRRDFYKIDQI